MHRDFDVARRSYRATERDPVTFTLAGEKFTVPFEPTLGDTMDLAAAPDVDPADFDPKNPSHVGLIKVLWSFIVRAVPVDERERLNQARYSIYAHEAGIIIELAHWITEQVTGFPTEPPASSSSGRPTNGRASKKRTGGASRSK